MSVLTMEWVTNNLIYNNNEKKQQTNRIDERWSEMMSSMINYYYYLYSKCDIETHIYVCMKSTKEKRRANGIANKKTQRQNANNKYIVIKININNTLSRSRNFQFSRHDLLTHTSARSCKLSYTPHLSKGRYRDRALSLGQ